ncbi:2'-5' RNA ligase family protein [Chryseobacterium sp. MYb264]|nr:2'-5' RNA ligase family protein [Chryseobacterium sp. MYb264]
MSPFEVTLNGFGSFPHSKHPVLYIKPEQNNHLNELYHRVQREFNFINYSFNPHITVGYRNLTFENYWKAWQIYKDKHYKTNFLVDEISLLRHDENWKIMARKKLSLSQ